MVIVYILAFIAIIYIIGTYVRKYLHRDEHIEEKDEETIAKEEVEAMIVHPKKENKITKEEIKEEEKKDD